MNTKHTVSLSRGHKIVERLTRLVDETHSAIEKNGQPYKAYLASDADEAGKRREKIRELLHKASVLENSLSVLRMAIAKNNGQVGIHELLAERAVLLQRARRLANTRRHTNDPIYDSPIDDNKVADFFEHNEKIGKSVDVAIRVMNSSMTEQWVEMEKAVATQLDKLNDAINDKNVKTQVSFDLPENVAELIGL